MSLINSKFVNNNIHSFTHQAMNTIFEIVIEADDKEYAEQAANAAFVEIDRLEDELSRYRPNSDVARINLLQVGEELKLSPDIFECLQIANHIYNITDGLFDVTSGELIDHWKNSKTAETDDYNLQDIGMGKLLLDDINYSINLLSNNIKIDLGGIGKGYAIDKACTLLTEWDVDNALIHSGSTVKAIGLLSGYDGWPVSISNPSNKSQTIAEVLLKDFSLSGSGKQKGSHIINPQTSLPINDRTGAWAMAESAAMSDAMSTTFMIMPVEDISEFCKKYDTIHALIILNNISVLTINDIFISNDLFFKNLLF